MLAERGVVLSREQVYRLVVNTPERLNLTTLAALCDILAVTPADLLEVTIESRRVGKAVAAGPGGGSRPAAAPGSHRARQQGLR